MRLRDEFMLDQVVDGLHDDLARTKAVCHWVHGRWSHDGGNETAPADAIGILNAAKKGASFRCVEYGIVSAACLSALGLPARVVGLMSADVETRPSGAGHVVAEAWLPDRKAWVMVDAQTDLVPVQDGKPLDVVAFRQALARHPPPAYPPELALCLHYFRYSLDNRQGGERKDVRRVILVPEGSSEPHVFQGTVPIENALYSHSLASVYGAPVVE